MGDTGSYNFWREIVDKTPESRDRYVDFLRALSILVVVIGHWLSAVVFKTNDGFVVRNAVGMVKGLWAITWILQVMPVFFFMLFVAIVGPLWFLVVYRFTTLVSPFMLKLHTTAREFVLLFLVILVIIVDILRFKANIPCIAYFNVAFVWLFVHQLGFLYEDGTLVNIQRWQKFLSAIIGLIGLLILTNTGIYPRSMIGTGFEKISNMNPPTLCIVALSLWLVGIAMLAREKVSKWLKKKTPWLLTIIANRSIMTLYLWHLTAYAISYLLLYHVGIGHYTLDNIGTWWIERPLWIIAPTIVLLGFVRIFGRLES